MSSVSSTTSTAATTSTATTTSTTAKSSGGTVKFSGLASGVDTGSIVDSLIEAESAPKTLLENKETYLKAKLETYNDFNELLSDFYAASSGINNTTDLNTYNVTNNGSDYFSVSTNSLAKEGTYSIKVVSLAQQQKDVSSDTIADTDTTTLSGELTIGDETISYDAVTLSGLVDLINEKDYGITASVINDGSGNGYRLMLTSDTAGAETIITGTGSVTLDTATDGHTVAGTKAHVVVDGLDYYSTSNSVTNAIKGATITLVGESDAAKTAVIESGAEDVISTHLEEMVAAYNAINSYVKDIYDSDPTLANTMKSVQTGLENYLTSNALVNLGVTSDWETGELSFDSETFATAYADDASAVKSALLGDNNDGLMNRLDDYMGDKLSTTDGFLAAKKTTINKEISRLDDSIAAMETRIEKRRTLLEAQFTAMETLVSSLNSQGDYLTNFFDSYTSTSS